MTENNPPIIYSLRIVSNIFIAHLLSFPRIFFKIRLINNLKWNSSIWSIYVVAFGCGIKERSRSGRGKIAMHSFSTKY